MRSVVNNAGKISANSIEKKEEKYFYRLRVERSKTLDKSQLILRIVKVVTCK